MFGIGFIVSEKGEWCCSDDVYFEVEKDPIFGQDKKNLSETKTLKYLSIFEGVKGIIPGLKVWCLFKANDKKMGFTGVVRGQAGNLTIVDIDHKVEDINSIIKKIKGGKQNG